MTLTYIHYVGKTEACCLCLLMMGPFQPTSLATETVLSVKHYAQHSNQISYVEAGFLLSMPYICL